MTLRSLAALTLMTASLVACGDNSTPTAAPAAPAPNATGSVDATRAEAEKLLTDAATYVKENKMDLADKALARLEELKPKLPAEYGPKIDQLKQLITTAKGAAGKLPAGVTIPQ
jgi:hypothetical protein